MIYTMTLNPALDLNVITEHFESGRVNRASHTYFLAGGKGLMESQMLKNIGVESTAMGLVAGFTGKELVRMVHELGIHTNFVTLSEGMTRINVKLWGGIEGEINASGPKCDEKSLQALYEKLEVLNAEDTLLLAGTIPAGLPQNLYAKLFEQLKDRHCRIVVDATGELLKSVIPYRPFLVKPNHHELGELYGIELKTKEAVLPYAKKLRAEGAKNVLISMAGEGAVLAAEDGSVWFGNAPEGQVKNSVGAGDSMVAGFVAAYLDTRSVAEAFRNGIACGSASAFSDSLATKEEVAAVRERVEIQRIE